MLIERVKRENLWQRTTPACQDNIQTHRGKLGVKECIGFSLFRDLCSRLLKFSFHNRRKFSATLQIIQNSQSTHKFLN